VPPEPPEPPEPPGIDVDAERAATPGCATVVHLNNAGAALPTAATVQAEVDHLWLEARLGGYEAAAAVGERLAAVRRSAAHLLGADDDEVVLTGSDTQGWARALWGFALGGGIAAGQRMLIDRLAYDSHYITLLQIAEECGAALEVVPSEPDGTVALDELRTALGAGRVAFCAATHVGTHRGLVNPVEEMGAECRAAGVPFFVDACQSAGQLPLDVEEMGCDVLTATGRKWLRGPRGTGLLYVRRAMAERMRPPGVGGDGAIWIDADRYELRPGTTRFVEFEAPIAAHLGLGVALAHAAALGIEAVRERVDALAEELRRLLRATDGVTEHDGGRIRAGIVTFTVEGVAPPAVRATAAAAGVNVSVSESPAARLDMTTPRPGAVVRASPHYYNTDEELDALIEVVQEIAPEP
jgi:cysteine desulfurase / selenocysteine lyase